MRDLIEVPPGLQDVAVADTAVGAVDGDAGSFHYRGFDAVELARRTSFEAVWFLLAHGRLPTDLELDGFRGELAEARSLPPELRAVVDAVARVPSTSLSRLRTAMSTAAAALGVAPLLDLDDDARRRQAVRVAAVVPTVSAALQRRADGQDRVIPPDSAGHVDAYLWAATGRAPRPEHVRALERYLVLTIDHGFNASTFTGRVVASTGADLCDVVCAALGALAGPLHGGAPSRALDALDAIGVPERAGEWVRAEVAAGRRIMGFGHAVYRAPDPRSTLLREIAVELGGELVERAVAVEVEILATLAELKPDRPLPSNVEFYAGVIMETVGLPRAMFTPTFAVSRSVGWVTHALEQVVAGKLIRPAARYVGPEPTAVPAGVG